MLAHRAGCLVVASTLVLATIGFCYGAPTNGASPGQGSSRWSWLGENGGTYWYVPQENLEAIMWQTAAPANYAPIEDQTVWHIESFANGYLFGPLVVKFAGYPPLCQYMIGSVTPSGSVYISFNAVQTIPHGSPSITTGTGDMVKQAGAWTFNMQMASGSSETQISHWAFMQQCTASQPCWSDLPGPEQSLPAFLAQCGYS